jgi:hypothetical protein
MGFFASRGGGGILFFPIFLHSEIEEFLQKIRKNSQNYTRKTYFSQKNPILLSRK